MSSIQDDFFGEQRRYPHYFNLKEIEKHAIYYLNKGLSNKSMELFDFIEKQWVLNRDNINESSPNFRHLEYFTYKSIFNTVEGKGGQTVYDQYLIDLHEMRKLILGKPPPRPQRFDNLVKAISSHLSCLKKCIPPILSEEGIFLLGPRSKGAIVAYIDVLINQGIIQHNFTPQEISKALNLSIDGLHFGADGRSLQNPYTTAYKKYYKQIEENLSSS